MSLPLAAAAPQGGRKRSDRRDGELLVRFRADAAAERVEPLLQSHGVTRRLRLQGASHVERLALAEGQEPEQAAERLRANAEVEFAEPNYIISADQAGPNDPLYAEQWALQNAGGGQGRTAGADIRAAQAWAMTTGSPKTVIAVIDSGVDFTHPDLKNNQWKNAREVANGRDDDRNGYRDDTGGWDWVAGSGEVKDPHGHGTAVAGIIAAEGNNAEGTAGVMWRASLMSLRVLDEAGAGDVARAVEAIDYAVANGAQVINCSWGTANSSQALRDAIERAAARGVVVVAPAGNLARDLETQPYYPASYDLPNVIAVAATDASDKLATWSNYGRNVHVAAPGVGVLTAARGGGQVSVTGTSVSVPHVSGIAGLLKSVRPYLEAGRTREAIAATARPAAGLETRVASGGVADAASALAAVAAWPQGQGFDLKPEESNVGGVNDNGGGRPRRGSLASPEGRDKNRKGAPPPRRGKFRRNQPDLTEARRRASDPLVVPTPIPAQHPDYVRGEPVKAPGEVITADYVDSGRYMGSHLSVARLDPTNRVGTSGEDLFSGNYNWTLPLVGLKGRAGLDLGLALSYNSLVWTRLGYSYMFFDEDRGYPSPGFRLGFPVVQSQFYNDVTGKYAYMLITPSGRRVELRQVNGTNVYEAVDSSYLQLIDYGSWKLVRDTSGTQLTMSDDGAGQYKCTQVKDRNGNYITVTYSAGRISAVTDTLGRVLNFNYDGNGRLSTITQQRGGSTYTWATFGYSNLYVTPNFPGMWVYGPYNQTISVLTNVWTADSARHDFAYNPFGQVYRIERFAPAGNFLSRLSYNLPVTSTAQSDCPRFSERREWAAEWNGDDGGTYSMAEEAVTSFGIEPGDVQTMTMPDGQTVYKEFNYTSGWGRGLTYRTETWHAGVRKKWTTASWTQDQTWLGYQQNPRITETNVWDDEGNRRRRKTIDYHASFGLPWIVTDFAADAATVLRRTYFDYKTESAYIDRRIIGLPFRHSVYDASWNLLSKTEFHYDWDWGGDMFQDTPAPATQHDRVNYGPGFITGRGNLSVITRFDATDPNNAQNTWQETKFRHNSTGSVLMERDHQWHMKFFSYNDSFSDGANRNTFAYPTAVTDEDNFTSTTQYDFHSGRATRTQDPKGAVREMQYDAVGRLERVTTPFNGAYTRYVYPSTFAYVQSLSTVNNVADEAYAINLLDGAGRTISAGSAFPGSAGGYKALHYVFDAMGRLVSQTNMGEMDGNWNAAGDDAAGWRWSTQTYDWQGRPRVTTNTDGTTREVTYDGCGCAGSQVVTVRDEVSRRQRATYDALGRLSKTEILNADGSVYRSITNTYSPLDQVTQIDDQAGGVTQVTQMTYDGSGRLKTRRLPHETAPTTFNYRSDDVIESITDPRGVTNTYSYNNRHLLTGITYGTAPGVESTGNVTFGYDEAGNRTLMAEAGLGQVTYSYDTLSRLTGETRQFVGLGGSYPLTYGYNLAGQLTSITDHLGATTHYNRDAQGQAHSLTASGTLYAGVWLYAQNIRYRAWGALKGLTYGNNYTLSLAYDARMRPSQFTVAGGPGTTMLTQFSYYGDGQLRFADDGLDDRFDRAYGYDHAGRLAEAFSGAEAREFVYGQPPSGIQDGPYRQSYTYDPFNNITSRVNRFWSQTDSFTATYTNNRRDGWTYDAAGNLLSDGQFNYKWDAAGRNREMGNPSTQRASVQWHSGDNQVVKGAVWQSGSWTEIEYFVRSTALDGRVVTELDRNGQKRKGYVYLGGEVIAEQGATTSAFAFRHDNPVTGARTGSDPWGGHWTALEPDPSGVNVGVEDPFVNPDPPLFEPQPEQPMLMPLFDQGCSSWNPNCQQCYLDGFAIGCDRAMHLLDIGAAEFDTWATVRVTYTSGRVDTFTGHSNLPPGLDITFRGSEAVLAGAVFQFWMPNFSFAVNTAIGAVMVSRMLAGMSGETGGGDLFRGFSSSFTQQPGRAAPTQVNVPIGGIDKLKTLLETRLQYGDCKDAISKVIEKIAALSGIKASHTQVMDLFNKIVNQTGGGGIYMDFIRPQMNQNIPPQARIDQIAGGSGLAWTFGSSNNPQRIIAIFLKGAYSNSPRLSFERLPYDYFVTAVHELIHQAPGDKYSLYDHKHMDDAARELGARSIDDYIAKHCNPPEHQYR